MKRPLLKAPPAALLILIALLLLAAVLSGCGGGAELDDPAESCAAPVQAAEGKAGIPATPCRAHSI